jgi:hypothetical protein
MASAGNDPAQGPDLDWDRIAAAIAGPRQQYYMRQFRRIAAGRVVSWNSAAALSTFVWARYRRMYGWSWKYLLLSTPAIVVILSWVEVLLSMANIRVQSTCDWALTGAAGIGASGLVMPAAVAIGFIVPGFLGNHAYFRHIRDSLAGRENDGAAAPASATGKPWGSLLDITAVCIIASMLVAPQGASHSTRQQVADLIATAAIFTAVIDEFHERNHRLPANQAEAFPRGLPAPGGAALARSARVLDDGAVSLVASFAPAEGRSITLRPEARKGKLDWTCRSPDLPVQCLPRTCRP